MRPAMGDGRGWTKAERARQKTTPERSRTNVFPPGFKSQFSHLTPFDARGADVGCNPRRDGFLAAERIATFRGFSPNGLELRTFAARAREVSRGGAGAERFGGGSSGARASFVPPIIANACWRPMIMATRMGVSSLRGKNCILRVSELQGTEGMHKAFQSKSPTSLAYIDMVSVWGGVVLLLLTMRSSRPRMATGTRRSKSKNTCSRRENNGRRESDFFVTLFPMGKHTERKKRASAFAEPPSRFSASDDDPTIIPW